MSSFDSVNGPSITVRLSPSKRTRAAFDVGWRPSPASITPALTSSSLKLPMSVSSFSSGISPRSLLSSPGTSTMTRIGFSSDRGLYVGVERALAKSTRPRNLSEADPPLARFGGPAVHEDVERQLAAGSTGVRVEVDVPRFGEHLVVDEDVPRARARVAAQDLVGGVRHDRGHSRT